MTFERSYYKVQWRWKLKWNNTSVCEGTDPNQTVSTGKKQDPQRTKISSGWWFKSAKRPIRLNLLTNWYCRIYLNPHYQLMWIHKLIAHTDGIWFGKKKILEAPKNKIIYQKLFGKNLNLMANDCILFLKKCNWDWAMGVICYRP